MSKHLTTSLINAAVCIAFVLMQGACSRDSGPSPSDSSDTSHSVSPDEAAEQLAQVFPDLYWHAADACLRETTRDGLGFSQTHDEYVKRNKAVIEKLEEVSVRGKPRYALRLRLHDPEHLNEYWLLEFRGANRQWEPQTGVRYLNGKQMFNLFEDEYVFGRKVMGSMKPYFQKLLAAYAAGKEFDTVFATKK